MEIKFEKEERPVKVQQRINSPEQLDFMKKQCDELLEVRYLSQLFLEVGMFFSHRAQERIREIALYRRSPYGERSNKEEFVADASC